MYFCGHPRSDGINILETVALSEYLFWFAGAGENATLCDSVLVSGPFTVY